MVDDLRRRREELERDVANALAGATPVARGTMESAIVRLSSIGFPLQQFRLSETLDQMCTDARRLYAELRSRLEAQDRERLDSFTDAVVSLRRLDALSFLHLLLKSWLVPHVVVTSVMLALLSLHIAQAFYGVR